jgi:penicillin V acylase-like amidase (Ntn superfamily)
MIPCRWKNLALIATVAAGLLSSGLPVFPCSTFLLRSGGLLLVGHNLDEQDHIPGLVFINKRNVAKTALSWAWLLSGKTDKTPPLAWTSKYASLTFNPYGREFPDDGLNEAGLFIGEMTLRETRYPFDPAKPRLFMSLWMQHLLDTCRTVEEVVESASALNIDGWGWHFFAADRSGQAASVEFVEGKIVVHRGDTLPVPVLGNSLYEEEMVRLAEYSGFGGDKPISLEDMNAPRFVQAALLLRAYRPALKPPVDYCFDILRQMGRGTTRWSLVCDLKSGRAFFRTDKAQGIKSVRLGDFDPGCDQPARFLDIHADLAGDVRREFEEYSREANRAHVRQAWEAMLKIAPAFEWLLKMNKSTRDEVVERFASYPEQTQCRK